MAYLLDTDVLSGTRRPDKINPALEKWLRPLSPKELFISAMTIGEIEKGITKQQTIDPDFASDLQTWLDELLTYHADRIIPVTTNIARRWGNLSQQLGNSNVDILIAATALEHGLTIATRNTKHFSDTGAALTNPFD